MSHLSHGPVRGGVESVEDISKTFSRIAFSGPQLQQLFVEGPFYDQRIKLIFRNTAGVLPDIEDTPDWYQRWLAMRDAERGVMRTYPIRELTRDDGITRMAVDFVLHFAKDGSTGPAAAWAADARVGQELWLVAPRQGQEASGIEFAPGGADEVVLLGDEAAAPAIDRILEDIRLVGTTARISAYIEVPNAEDQLDIRSEERRVGQERTYR